MKYPETIASDCIQELASKPEVLAYYREHTDGDCDFVWIEEGLSYALTLAGYTHDTHDEAYMIAAGIVFRWLTRTHGVTPPRWFREKSRS